MHPSDIGWGLCVPIRGRGSNSLALCILISIMKAVTSYHSYYHRGVLATLVWTIVDIVATTGILRRYAKLC